MATAENTHAKPAEEQGGGKERRASLRLDCDLFAEAIVPHRGRLFRGKIRDISRTGCFIETRARLNLERLTLVELGFKTSKDYCHIRSRVMNIRPGRGVGLEFLPADFHAERQLRKLLEALGSAVVQCQG